MVRIKVKAQAENLRGLKQDYAGTDSVVVVLKVFERRKERRAESDQFHNEQQL